MRREWSELVEREGTAAAEVPLGVELETEGDMPCPACGTAAPLVGGACSDCGLQLE
jgi:hypothetical protein